MGMPKRATHILIVEDNEDDLFLIQEAFAEIPLGGDYAVVRDGEEALRYMRREGEYRNAKPADLVLLDINMPKRDGFEVLREMKGDPGLRHLPVIMLTTSSRELDVVRSYADGASSYIIKPVRYDDFREVLRRFVGYWTDVAQLPTR